MNPKDSPINRRQFLQQGAGGTGLLMLAGAALPSLAPAATVNKFPYDVERFKTTDPKLIGYELQSRFASPLPLPRSLAQGAGDHLFVAGKTGVAVVDASGRLVRQIDTAAPVRCVALDPAGTTVYAGLRDHVRVFNPDGKPLATWEPPDKKAWITGLAVGKDEVFAADSANRCIWRLTKDGKVAGQIGAKDKEREIPGLIVPSPYLGVKLGPDGLLRVNNPGRHRVELYTTDGHLELFWGKPTAAVEGFCGCCNPIGLALMADNKYVTCEKGLPRVKVYSEDGKFECVVAGPEMFPKNARTGATRNSVDGTMGGLDATVDSQGRVWVLDLVAEEILTFKRKQAI